MKTTDLTNEKFERLLVVKRAGSNKYGRARWKCVCDCGNVLDVDSRSLISGNTKSCGCLKNEAISTRNKKHGYSKTHIYFVWQKMIERCNKKSDKSYHNYGGRGISVCKEWEDSFIAFLDDMGETYKEGLTIERIDNSKGYSKDNCKWVSHKEQARNTRRNRHIKVLITDACRLINVPISTVYSMSNKKNISLQEAFNIYYKRFDEGEAE